MLLMPCFVDESGRDERATVFAMAGVMCSQALWLDLDNLWHCVLRGYGIRRYKWSSIKDWSSSRRDKMHDELIGLLHDKFRCVGVCLPVGDYSCGINDSGFAQAVKRDLPYFHNPYTLGAMHITMELRDHARSIQKPKPGEPRRLASRIAPVFDRCGRETDDFLERFHRLNSEGLLNDAICATVSRYWEIEVADLVCGQYRAAAEEYLATGQWAETRMLSVLRAHSLGVRLWNFDTIEKLRSSCEEYWTRELGEQWPLLKDK